MVTSTHTWPYDANGAPVTCEERARYGRGPLGTCGASAAESCARCGKALCPKHIMATSHRAVTMGRPVCASCYAGLIHEHGGLPR